MTSLAWYTFFNLALDELDGQRKSFHDVRRFAAWLLCRPSFALPEEQNFDVMVEVDRLTAPNLSLISAPSHELVLWRRITDERLPPIEAACKLLVRLVARWGDEVACYKTLALPQGALGAYPLTLDSLNQLAKARWRGLSCQQWLKSLLVEVLSAHQRVAIRTLGEAGENTLMFRISEAVHRKLDGVVETSPDCDRPFKCCSTSASHSRNPARFLLLPSWASKH